MPNFNQLNWQFEYNDRGTHSGNYLDKLNQLVSGFNTTISAYNAQLSAATDAESMKTIAEQFKNEALVFRNQTEAIALGNIQGTHLDLASCKIAGIDVATINGHVANATNAVNATNADKLGNQLPAYYGKQSDITALNNLVFSSDTALDEIQEIVNYIKLNRTDLDALSINSIAGLALALAAKAALSGNNNFTGTNAFSGYFSVTGSARLNCPIISARKGFFVGDGASSVFQDLNGTWLHNNNADNGVTTEGFLGVGVDGTPQFYDTSYRKVYHSGNDGTDSGLDADLLDGFHASAFARGDTLSPSGLYYQIRGKDNANNYICTPLNGLLPNSSDSAGVGSIGYSSWPFKNMYAKTFYGDLSGNASTSSNSSKLEGSTKAQVIASARSGLSPAHSHPYAVTKSTSASFGGIRHTFSGGVLNIITV